MKTRAWARNNSVEVGETACVVGVSFCLMLDARREKIATFKQTALVKLVGGLSSHQICKRIAS